MSKAAQTHKLRKLRAPSKCRECDSLVVFHGAECEEVTAAEKGNEELGVCVHRQADCVCSAVFFSLPQEMFGNPGHPVRAQEASGPAPPLRHRFHAGSQEQP